MDFPDSRTNDWILELHSIDSLDDPASQATPNFDDVRLPRWSTELTPGDGLGEPRARSTTARPPSPLPGAAECLDFIKTRSGRFRPARETRLRNNLLAAVGFLEFGNAGDFAANICKFLRRTCLRFRPARAQMNFREAGCGPVTLWDNLLCGIISDFALARTRSISLLVSAESDDMYASC